MAMNTACYQVVSPPGTLRLWVGVSPATAVPAVDGWRLDGQPVAPASVTTVRAMQSVRAGALLDGNPPRAFTGVYEIAGVAGPARQTVELSVGGQPLTRRVKTLPPRIELDGDPLTVLLVSCFDYSTDGQLYGQLLPRIVRGAEAPDLCLFMGDQVYLDLPTLMNFQDDPVWLARKFEQDYARNWFSGAFAHGFGLAPMAFVPDDHEYWNNFPHASPFIQNSWSAGGQASWRLAARACYDGFQLGVDATREAALTFDVEPLSFLLLDSRSDRNPPPPSQTESGRTDLGPLLSDRSAKELAAWAARVAADSRLVAGVMVTGQSLLEDPVGVVTGAVADYALANYEGPYRALLAALTTIAESGKQVLLLTGDVHWGRVTSVRDRRRDTTAFHELISSPASLVATIGSDQVADAIDTVKGWFGRGNAWPRHGDAKAPPSHLPHSDQRWRTSAWLAHRGNQCAVLRMARRGSGVTVDYTFHPLAAAGRDLPSTTGHFELLRTT